VRPEIAARQEKTMTSDNSDSPGGLDPIFERIADIPWGVLLVLALVALLAFGKVKGDDIQTIRALAASAGLFGIGHGIHSGAKHFAKRRRDR
jgi:hypothetical protein